MPVYRWTKHLNVCKSFRGEHLFSLHLRGSRGLWSTSRAASIPGLQREIRHEIKALIKGRGQDCHLVQHPPLLTGEDDDDDDVCIAGMITGQGGETKAGGREFLSSTHSATDPPSFMLPGLKCKVSGSRSSHKSLLCWTERGRGWCLGAQPQLMTEYL